MPAALQHQPDGVDVDGMLQLSAEAQPVDASAAQSAKVALVNLDIGTGGATM